MIRGGGWQSRERESGGGESHGPEKKEKEKGDNAV
jgi:hypothetical protein